MDNNALFDTICYLVAFILMLLAAFEITVRKVSLMALALAAFILPFLVHAIQHLN